MIIDQVLIYDTQLEVPTPHTDVYVVLYKLSTDGLIYSKDQSGTSTVVGGGASLSEVNGLLYPASGSAVGAVAPVEIDFRTGGLKKVILLTTNADGGAFTLPDGNLIGALDSFEITLVLAEKVVNDAVITPTNLLGYTTIYLAILGDSVTLIYNEVIGKWIVKDGFNFVA